jgi:hypothetical protein
MRKGLKKRHYIGGVILISLMGFQNCSDTTDESQDLNSTSSYTQSLPFAYKASLDTISYMSCSRMSSNYEPRAFFTFRAGAYTPSGGLQINPDFIDATKYYSLQAKADAFGESGANANARLQLAIRSTTNFQSVVVNGAAKNGTSLGTMMTSLSGSPLVENLVTMPAGVKKHYFPSSASDRLMASSLRFNDGSEENVVAAIRTMMKNHQAMLALTYTATDNADDKTARSPVSFDANGTLGTSVNATNDVYGTGYQLNFGTPANWATGEQRVLSSVSEVDLASNMSATGGTWTCPSSMQFVIVRNEDIANVSNCDLAVDYYNTEAQRVALDAIRRVLPVEDFYVDVVNRCVVAKSHIATQSCYGDRSGRGAIDYSTGSCSGDSCPHYVSVCVRTN